MQGRTYTSACLSGRSPPATYRAFRSVSASFSRNCFRFSRTPTQFGRYNIFRAVPPPLSLRLVCFRRTRSAEHMLYNPVATAPLPARRTRNRWKCTSFSHRFYGMPPRYISCRPRLFSSLSPRFPVLPPRPPPSRRHSESPRPASPRRSRALRRIRS